MSLLIFLTFDLMLLGAAVRAMDAGLACPDWPLCFGKIIPDYHFGVYLEFLHRAVAGLVSIIFFYCLILTFVKKSLHNLRWYMSISFLLLMSQVIMGGLTVLKILHSGIVATHLGLATAFLISLVFIRAQFKDYKKEVPTAFSFKMAAIIVLFLVCAQIILGGLVASTYAGMACVDFPTCNGEWFPTWTGPIGLQVMHRMGAYTLTGAVIILFIMALVFFSKDRVSVVNKNLAAKSLMLIFSQVAIGIMNLKLLIPAWLTVIHLGVALFLLMTILDINLRVWSKT